MAKLRFYSILELFDTLAYCTREGSRVRGEFRVHRADQATDHSRTGAQLQAAVERVALSEGYTLEDMLDMLGDNFTHAALAKDQHVHRGTMKRKRERFRHRVRVSYLSLELLHGLTDTDLCLIDLATGRQLPGFLPVYFVSLAEYARVFDAVPLVDQVEAYVNDILSVRRPGTRLLSSERDVCTGVCSLNLNVLVVDYDAAMQLAHAEQRATIWDNGNQRMIRIGYNDRDAA